jgi:integrase
LGIWKDKVRKTWVYEFQYLRKSYGSGGHATRREAEAARSKRREDVKVQVTESIKATKTDTAFSVVSNDYLDFAQRKFVQDVYLRKVSVCRGFLKTIGDMPVDTITPRHVQIYLQTLKTNSLYNEYRHELSALFNWVKKIYIAQLPYLINPCITVESMSHITAEKVIPTEEEILRLIAAAVPGDEQDILLTCIQTLGRIDEVLRLRWHEDINFEKRYVVLWTRKRKNGAYEPDALPMNKDLYDVLYKRWKERKQDKWVFYNKQTNNRFMARPKMMTSLCRRAGTPPYGFHSLRHFMASYLMDEEKVSLKTVSGLLRHKNVRTTEIYLHSIDTSKVAASDKIQGKFTLKLTEPLNGAAKEKKGVDGRKP